MQQRIQKQLFLHLSCGCNRERKMMLHPTAEAPKRPERTRTDTRKHVLRHVREPFQHKKKQEIILGCGICLGGCAGIALHACAMWCIGVYACQCSV